MILIKILLLLITSSYPCSNSLSYSIENDNLDLFKLIIERCNINEDYQINNEYVIHKILSKNNVEFIDHIVEKKWNLYKVNEVRKTDSYTYSSIEIINKYLDVKNIKNDVLFENLIRNTIYNDNLEKLMFLYNEKKQNINFENYIDQLIISKEGKCSDFIISRVKYLNAEDVFKDYLLQNSNPITLTKLIDYFEKAEIKINDSIVEYTLDNYDNFIIVNHLIENNYNTYEMLYIKKIKQFINWYKLKNSFNYKLDTYDKEKLESDVKVISTIIKNTKTINNTLFKNLISILIQDNQIELFYSFVDQGAFDLLNQNDVRLIKQVIGEIDCNTNLENELKTIL